MPTQLEKTAAFLKKIAADGSVLNKGLWGADAPFQQPAPGYTQQEVVDAIKKMETDKSPDVQDSIARARQSIVEGGGADRPGVADTAAARLGLKGKEAPGLMSNIGAGLARGHVGTVAATGAAALLAGVLTYNMLKKKSKGKITQMPGQRKAAQVASVGGTIARGMSKAKDAVKGAFGKVKGTVEANPRAAAAAAGAAGGAALTQGANAALGGEKNLAEQVGLPAGLTTGSKGGDLAVAGGAAALGTAGPIALYKKLRGE